MRNRFPHGGEVLGAAPANQILAPVLSQDRGLRLSRQRDLLDLQAIQRIPGLVGYWKSDPQYLFEDSAGTTPASTNGTGPVGHWKPVGIQTTLGPELVTDPGFDNAAAWATKTNFVVANSVLTIDDATPYQSFAQLATVSLGLNWYEIVIVIDSVTSGSFKTQHSNGTTTTYSSILMNAAGTYRFYHYTQNNTTIGIRTESLGFVGVISSISMRLVSGIPAAQPTTANKPILRKTPTTGVYWADSNTSTSALNVALGNLGSACTVARSGAEGVTFTEGVTISSTYNIAPAFGFNADVAIFNRALTETEKALITRYMQRAVPLLGSNIANAINTSLSVWTAGGTNTKEFGPDGLTITYVDNTAGYTMLRSNNSELTTNLTVGVYYLLKTRIKAVGSVSLRVQNGVGVALCLAVILPTEFEMRTIGFCAVNAGSSMVQFFNFSAGESATVGPITLVPVL